MDVIIHYPQKGNLVKSLRILVSCSGFPWRETGMRRRKGAFIAQSLQGSASLSIPAGSLLTLQKSCWVEKRHCTPGHPSLPKPGGQKGLGGSGWDVLPWCSHCTWSRLTPQGLQLCTALEHFHFNRHSPKCLLQKWLSLRHVWLWIWRGEEKKKKNIFILSLSFSNTEKIVGFSGVQCLST